VRFAELPKGKKAFLIWLMQTDAFNGNKRGEE
jgi:hypothetical protein